MTARSAKLEADLAIIPDGVNIGARTVVALPPSDVDPYTDEMRVMAGSQLISRAFDPGQPIVTGAPLVYVTSDGDTYVTSTGDRYVTGVQ